jgi:chromosome segregation ATPase
MEQEVLHSLKDRLQSAENTVLVASHAFETHEGVVAEQIEEWKRKAEFWKATAVRHEAEISCLKEQLASKTAQISDLQSHSMDVGLANARITELEDMVARLSSTPVTPRTAAEDPRIDRLEK